VRSDLSLLGYCAPSSLTSALHRSQFSSLRQYLFGIYNSPLLERGAVRTFKEALPAAEAASLHLGSYQDLLWRQYTHGDVIGRLKARVGEEPVLVSVQPENPPELAFYVRAAGAPQGYSWSKTQAQCLFAAAKKPLAYFQTKVLGLPGTPVNRTEFLDEGLADEGQGQGQGQLDITDCFSSEQDVSVLRGYLAYLGKQFVEPEMRKAVLEANSGLLMRRSARELILGYQSPILQLSLARDDPRARLFPLMVQDPSLQGPAYCLTAADMSNPYTACRLKGLDVAPQPDGSNLTTRVFEKVEHTFHTGSDDVGKLGAWQAYFGDSSIAELWPGGAFPLEAGARDLPGSVQYGFSDGTQFPPFGAVEAEGARLAVFIPNFMMPVFFDSHKDVHMHGVRLRR
jgi:hypothetical protein